MGRVRQLCNWIMRWRYPAVPVAVGVVLTLPSLWVGLQADDFHLRAVILGDLPRDDLPHDPWAPYTWLDGVPEHNRLWMDLGWLPWWTDVQCRARLMRPLTALTMMVDHRLWTDWPVLMHLHSLVWYGLVILAAAALYRRVIGPTHPIWIAGLAALLFAVDDAHAVPAGWLANRNALVAGFFGICTILAHDRWRRDGWKPGMVLAPLALLAALLGKEEAVSVGGYLLAYALFLDRGSWRRRLAALWPCLLAGALWFGLHRGLGYGVFASEVYVDPLTDPARFAQRVVQYAPALLLGQLALPPSDLAASFSTSAFWAYWLAAVVLLVLLGLMFAPLLARSAVARFWGLGMVLGAVPICAIFPGDRLLMFVGLGAMPLLALWLGGLLERADWLWPSLWWRRPARLVATLLIAIHLLLAPPALAAASVSMRFIGGIFNDSYATLPDEPEFADQTAVFVNEAACIARSLMFHYRRSRSQPVPLRSLTLSPSCCAATLTRTDERTLVVRPHGGYLRPHRWVPPDEESPPPLTSRYHLQHLDHLVRSSDRPMRLGERVELTTATIEITKRTGDGRPAEATFRFNKPLEDPSLRWFVLRRGVYQPFTPPTVGQTVEVPSPLD